MQQFDNFDDPLKSSKVGSFGVIAVAAFALIFVGAVTWFEIKHSQTDVIEYQARDLAETVAALATTMRSTYAREVVQKLKSDGLGSHLDYKEKSGYVPLPAQFLKEVGNATFDEVNGLYRYKPISRWNLEESQGLSDDFQHWAWQQLEAQDTVSPTGPNDWQPIWRIEQVNGVPTLRYMRADPASSESCVKCHNAMELSDNIIARRKGQNISGVKQWKTHQLLGALEVQIPLQRVVAVASGKSKGASRHILGVFAASLLAIFAVVWANGRRIRTATRRLHWQANHDLLTGLKNRHALEEELGHVLNNRREGQEYSLLFIDLDRFKIVNDTCGHKAGDTLLKQIAQLLVNNLRNDDLAFRVGGDEYVVLLQNCDIKQAQVVSEKLRRAVKDHRLHYDNQTFSVGVSVGLVPIDANSHAVEDVIAAADVACYVAKSSGRNCVHTSVVSDDESSKNYRDTIQWARTISTSIENNFFRLAVQTAKSLNATLPSNYHEVLLRLDDPTGASIQTNNLIAAAERFDLTQDIDRWVVTTAIMSINEGIIPCDEDNIVAINLSGNTITNTKFLENLKQIFEQNDDINPGHLCFEITETSAVSNIQVANVFLKTLKEIGCSVALDDFGSGFNSLSSLKSLTFDYLKIDGQFIREYGTSPLDKAIVEAAIHFGKVMNIPVIAEWVETTEIRDRLASLDVDYTQGYAIHKPRIIELPNSLDFSKTRSLGNVA